MPPTCLHLNQRPRSKTILAAVTKIKKSKRLLLKFKFAHSQRNELACWTSQLAPAPMVVFAVGIELASVVTVSVLRLSGGRAAPCPPYFGSVFR